MSDGPSDPSGEASGSQSAIGGETPIFVDRSRWLWGVALGLVAFALGAFLVSKPVYRLIKVQRARSFSATGTQALADHNLTEASRCVRAALGLAPKDPQVLRFIAQFCTKTGSAQGLGFWQQLLVSKAATTADSQEYARFAQDLGRLDLSGTVIRDLVAADPENATNQLLAIDQHVLLRNWGPAVRGAELYLQKHPKDSYASYIFARAVMAGGDTKRAGQAKEILDGLAKGTTEQRLPALRTLGGIQGLPPAEQAAIAQQLETAPGSTALDRLQAIDIRWRINPAESAQSLKAVGALLADSNEPAPTAQFVGWLRKHGGQTVVLDSIPIAKANTNEFFAMHRLEAFADLKRWSDFSAVVKNPRSPLSPVARFCATAMLEGARGDLAALTSALNSAVKAAGSNVERLQQIAVLALTEKMPEIARESAERLLADPKSALWAADFLLQLAKTRDDMVIERAVYSRLAEQLGAEMVVVAEKAYLDLLFDDDIATARAKLARLFAANSTSLAVRTILAFAELKLGKPSDALTLLDGAKVEWTQQEPRWQVIAAVVFEGNQQRAIARRLAAKIDTRLLKAPERHLLETGVTTR